MSLRVLGVDPGTRTTGWGLIEAENGRVVGVRWGCLKAKRSLTRAQRLASLTGSLHDLLEEYQPHVVAVETPFVARFAKASLLLSQTRGALLAALGRWGGEVVEYEPARIKARVVGNGRAEKRQVGWLVQRCLGVSETVSEDAADALAVALCHLLETRDLQRL